MVTLYENIVQTCRERGVSPSKMCDDLGISRSVISDFGSGRKKSINVDTLGKIAQYLQVSPAVLMGPEYTTADSEVDEYRQALKDRPEMKTLFDKAKGATKEQLEAIANMLDVMKGHDDD